MAAGFIEVLNWSSEQCRDYLEAQRWANGVACPRCGSLDPYAITRRTPSKNGVLHLYKCSGCKRQFTATVGTIFEGSHVPLNKWFAAIFLLCSSKKGHSAHQIHRELGISYRAAWFMLHRIRSAMAEQGSPFMLSGTVEADETYIGGKAKNMHAAKRKAVIKGGRGTAGKVPVFGMVERGGRVLTQVVKETDRPTLEGLLLANIDTQRSTLMTDEHGAYRFIEEHLPHHVIRHQSEYVRGELNEIHTNSIESYWATLKRGLYGTYHHVDRGYLGCYLDEFSFRFNQRKVSDGERFEALVGQTGSGRLRWYFREPAEVSRE